jgi:hypothetical protein
VTAWARHKPVVGRRLSAWVSCLLACYAFILLARAFAFQSAGGEWKLNYWHLLRRALVLEQVEDGIQRERYCIPLSAYGRMLDHELPADCRVFLAGVLGEEGRKNLGYHTFFAYYLFPRHIDISFGTAPVFTDERVDGVPAPSAEALAAAGYTHVIVADQQSQLRTVVLANGRLQGARKRGDK